MGQSIQACVYIINEAFLFGSGPNSYINKHGIDNGSAGGRRGLPDTTVNIISLLFVIL